MQAKMFQSHKYSLKANAIKSAFWVDPENMCVIKYPYETRKFIQSPQVNESNSNMNKVS